MTFSPAEAFGLSLGVGGGLVGATIILGQLESLYTAVPFCLAIVFAYPLAAASRGRPAWRCT